MHVLLIQYFKLVPCIQWIDAEHVGVWVFFSLRHKFNFTSIEPYPFTKCMFRFARILFQQPFIFCGNRIEMLLFLNYFNIASMRILKIATIGSKFTHLIE